MAVRMCGDCRGKVSDSAKVCPHCGSTRPPKKTVSGRWVVGGLVLFVFYLIGSASDSPQASSGAKAAAAAPKREAGAAAKAALSKPKTKAELEQERRVARLGPVPIQSAWDGSYQEVEKYLEAIARDPDSVEIEGCTEVRHSSDGWVVGCNWRARNGFGGMNRNANWFTIKGVRVVHMHAYEAFRE